MREQRHSPRSAFGRFLNRSRLIYAALFALALFIPYAASAQVRSGDVNIVSLWAYPAIAHPGPIVDGRGNAKLINGYAIDSYATIINGGSPDAVTSVTSPAASVASTVSWFLGNQYPEAFLLSLPVNEPVALTPDTKFIRLYGLNKLYGHGESFPLTLHFRKAPEVTILVAIQNK